MLAIAVLALLQAPLDAKDLIDRVSKHYTEMKEFLVEYRQNRQTPHPLAINAAGALTIKAAKSGDRYFYSESGGRAFQIVGDGENVWHYDISRRQYIVEPAGLRADQIARERLKSSFLRFRMLDGQAMNARLLRMDERKGNGKPVQCAVIEISTARTDPFPWVEKLWIDPETATIYRSEFEGTGACATGGRVKTVFEFTLPAGIKTPDAALLEFHPPKGAKQVDQFTGTSLDTSPGGLIR
ncbi:hypothetical protein [uncultured Paludibaculum sp.]|uniref:LolA family protein n=1 Tax=uncultured Paludibaculum sp. TaxID=1765020 RepID=UPI002AAAADF8|nr:hypothetical protein [uncultured Paludibaculum sp.]